MPIVGRLQHCRWHTLWPALKSFPKTQKRLASFIQTKENIDKIVDMEANLKELCTRIVPDLDNCTNNDKKDAYTYLDLKVKATNEGTDIKGYLDPSVLKTDSCLLTTART